MTQPDIDPEDLITPYEAGRLLALQITSVRLLAENGRVRCTRTLGGHRRYFRSDIHRELERRAAER